MYYALGISYVVAGIIWAACVGMYSSMMGSEAPWSALLLHAVTWPYQFLRAIL